MQVSQGALVADYVVHDLFLVPMQVNIISEATWGDRPNVVVDSDDGFLNRNREEYRDRRVSLLDACPGPTDSRKVNHSSSSSSSFVSSSHTTQPKARVRPCPRRVRCPRKGMCSTVSMATGLETSSLTRTCAKLLTKRRVLDLGLARVVDQ